MEWIIVQKHLQALNYETQNFNLQWLDFLGITSISYKIVRPDKEKAHAKVMQENQKSCYATDEGIMKG